MGYLEKPWLNRSDNWKAVMAEVRYESALVFMEESGRSNVYGSESYKVMKLTMSGPESERQSGSGKSGNS